MWSYRFLAPACCAAAKDAIAGISATFRARINRVRTSLLRAGCGWDYIPPANGVPPMPKLPTDMSAAAVKRREQISEAAKAKPKPAETGSTATKTRATKKR